MPNRIQELAQDAIVKYASSEAWIFTNEELNDFAATLIQETLAVAKAGAEFGPSVEEAVRSYFKIKS